MSRPIQIAAICGSLRAHSVNRKLLHAAVLAAPPGTTIAEAAPRLGSLPLFNEDLEADPWPAGVVELAAALRQADALLIVTPEYNAGPPGVLKNALDWMSRGVPPVHTGPLVGKPVALIGATPGRLGTVRAQNQLRTNLQNMQLPVLPGPDCLIGGASSIFDASGGLVDLAAKKSLDATLAAFVTWIGRFRA